MMTATPVPSNACAEQGRSAEGRVPYLDLRAQYATIKDEIYAAVDEVMQRCAFVSGFAVERFEQHFAQYCEARDCIAVGSGTDALHLALLALGVGPGDEVITQTNTFVATLEAIVYTGAKPVLVDVVPPEYAMDLDAVAAAITPRTKAIVPVHLFGQPMPMEPIESLAAKHGIVVLEDASQAHGARYGGKRVGSRNMATWSFYPGKNLGAYGEGGGITVTDDSKSSLLRLLRSHGSERKYEHEIIGYNYRMDGVQGAVLDVKLRHLDRWNARRREIAHIYDAALTAVNKPSVPPNVEHVYHIYPIFVDDREAFRERLNRRGIETNVHFPGPCNLQPAFAHLGYERGAFPHSEMIAQQEVSLPIFAEMTDETAKRVAAEALASME